MKRRNHCTKDQLSLKKVAVSSSSETLQTRITTKLQTLIDGFVSELENISVERRSDVTALFNNQSLISNFINDIPQKKTTSSNNENSFDASTFVLKNFINSAKARIAGELTKAEIKEKNPSDNNLSETTNKPTAQVKIKTIITDPLQIQISLNLQSVLIRALDNKKLSSSNNFQDVSSSKNIKESELQDLSSVLQDFMSSAKKKLSQSLSKTHDTLHSEHSLGSQKNSAKSFSKKSQLCAIPQVSSINHKKNHSVELHTKCDSNSKYTSGQCKSNKQVKENFHCSIRLSDIFPSQKMNSSSASDSDSFDSSSPDIPSTSRTDDDMQNGSEDGILLISEAERAPEYWTCQTDYDMYQNGSEDGILLIGEAERAPEFLDLEIHTDVDDPSYEQSDSEEEVIVLGEKRPTYQEITLEEDDDGQVFEKVVEKALDKNTENENEVEELLFNCPKCEKVFRVESLLKFHIRMHGQEDSSSQLISASECASQIPDSESEDETYSRKSPDTNQSSIRKEKEYKLKSKFRSSTHKSKFHHEKRDKREKKKYMSKNS